MLAEKFFLVLETLRSHASDDGPRLVSSSPHVSVSLPQAVANPPEPTPNGSKLQKGKRTRNEAGELGRTLVGPKSPGLS
jgi:hypothetical protein